MSKLDEFFSNLSAAKSRELYEKYYTLLDFYSISEEGRSKLVSGRIGEAIAKDFIKEFLPTKFKVKSGLIYDKGKLSPQIDAIIFQNIPLLEYTDIAIVESKDAKGVLEVKGWIAENDLFGRIATSKESSIAVKGRNPQTGLFEHFSKVKKFLLPEIPYVLFTFSLSSASSDIEVINRLKQISDMHAIISRVVPRHQRKIVQEDTIYNFNESLSELIKWLRNLQ